MNDPGTLVLLRHGQSTANAAGMFTGLRDVSLSEIGRIEAITAAELLNAAGLQPELCVSSPMMRARQTVDALHGALRRPPTVTEFDWRLSERNYGVLTGLRKTEVLQRYGAVQFHRWRRSVDEAPPAMTAAAHARLVTGFGAPPDGLGLTESLRDVIIRVGGCYRARVLPVLRAGGSVLVVAHGNSLRALCFILDGLNTAEIESLNLPTGHPLVYRIGADGTPTPRGGLYLDPRAAHTAAATIALEGGT